MLFVKVLCSRMENIIGMGDQVLPRVKVKDGI
jgi:hypothetical protein